ncbi:MAG: amidohydrolase family protein [Oscillospiraceae bacterium]|nr:amidohydrolase family protein [Oscillospiraceae bacterium]
MKQLIKNGKIYDGTGAAPFTGDVLLEDDRIVKVAAVIDEEADRVYDLEGLSIAPGFIDGHSHNDWFAIKKEPLPYFAPFLRQGIATFVTGNCGVSAIGFEPDCPHMDVMGAGLFSFRDTTGAYGTLDEFFAAVDGNMPCNLSVLAGHCTARAAVSGSVNRKLTPEEEERMLAILEKALQQGAAGLSLGMMYDPGLYADVEEQRKLARLCVKYGRPLTVHPRAESKVSMAYPQLLGRAHILRAFDELAEISRGTPLKLHYSHAIFVGRSSFKYKDELLKMMDELRAGGVDVMFDIYDETLGVSVITVILPDWYRSMSPAEKKKPLTRLKLAALVKASSLLLGFGFKDIVVAYVGPGCERFEGKSVHQIAQEEGLSDLDAYLMLCEVSDFKGRVNMGPYSTPEIISEFEHNEHCLYMTDAWVEDHGVQNPAIYDCYPKFLRDSLLGTGDTMPNTIRRMTGAIADRFLLPERGYLKAGYFADLTVFDEEAIRRAAPDRERAFGIEKLFINGRLVLDGGELDEEALKTTGRAIRVPAASVASCA